MTVILRNVSVGGNKSRPNVNTHSSGAFAFVQISSIIVSSKMALLRSAPLFTVCRDITSHLLVR